MPQYKILGPLQVLDGGADRTPSRAMPSRLLALLLMRANRPVSTEAIITELWGESPPRTAEATIQSYVHHIRKKLTDGETFRATREILVTRRKCYLLETKPGELDSSVFYDLVLRGRKALEHDEHQAARNHLSAALDLWRGPALSDIAAGPLLEAAVVQLEECRVAATELRIESEIQLGRHREVVGELRSLVELHPLNERLRAQLMYVLHRSGRRCEALEEYNRARQMLNQEFGLEPDRELRSMQYDILVGEAG